MRTNWLYSPVHNTRRNSPDSLGNDVVISGKYAISCFGGSVDGVVNFILLRVIGNGLAVEIDGRGFAFTLN
jgi:hypothetical protein